MIVYQTNHAGLLVGQVVLDDSDRDPMAPDTYLLPGGCVLAPPPEAAEGMQARWCDGAWTVEPAHQADDHRSPTIDDIKAEAARRIYASGLSWMVEREVSGGLPIPQAVKDYAAAVRAASGAMEAMSPIPDDYTDNRYWPEMPV